MAYLKAHRVKGKTYYQLVEAYRESGKKKERVLLHLGTDIVSPHTILRWWDHLGRPRIPYKPGVPRLWSKETPSLATPCETIVDLNKFLSCPVTDEQLNQVIEGLKFPAH